MAIRKIDFYVGALLSYLITKRITPAIFDSSENSKIIKFETDEEKYNLFVKYSSKPAKMTDKCSRWDILFTDSEIKNLDFYLNSHNNHKNLVVLVCCKPNLKDTKIAVIDYDSAIRCLGTDKINNSKRISVKSDKNKRYLKCYGTALADKDALLTIQNIDKHF